MPNKLYFYWSKHQYLVIDLNLCFFTYIRLPFRIFANKINLFLLITLQKYQEVLNTLINLDKSGFAMTNRNIYSQKTFSLKIIITYFLPIKLYVSKKF